MIKTIQKKFIKTAMLAITVLLVVFIITINVVNIATIGRELHTSLDVLSEIGMGAPHRMEPLEPEKDSFGKFFSPVPDEERAMSARYFTVEISSEGQITKINTDNILSIAYEDAEELAARIILSGNEEGTVDGFKFKMVKARNGQGATFVCLDTADSWRGALTIAIISIGVGVACWLAMLLFVSLLSKKAIRPIAENLERQRRFVTDAGHEIKTPLAIILANTDALELHNGESKWSKNIRNQTARLNGLMQNLLTLSRSDEAQGRLVKEEINASEVLADIIEDFKTLADAQNKTIRIEIDENICAVAHRESLCQLFTVLIDNAVKYSSQSSDIGVSLKKENNKTVFITQNICDGLPDCEPYKLFERFYRGDKARTQKSGGYGIGLSVACAITKNHDWKIKAEYEKDNTIKFTVEM